MVIKFIKLIPFQDPPQYSWIESFGMKTNHLATQYGGSIFPTLKICSHVTRFLCLAVSNDSCVKCQLCQMTAVSNDSCVKWQLLTQLELIYIIYHSLVGCCHMTQCNTEIVFCVYTLMSFKMDLITSCGKSTNWASLIRHHGLFKTTAMR
jgi:hypothetical protein